MKVDWNRWRRRHRMLAIERYSIPMAYVMKVRTGSWRASMANRVGARNTTACASFNRMEDAMLWAQERLPMIELQELM